MSGNLKQQKHYMKNCKEIYLIGPGRSKLKYDTSKLRDKVIFNFSGDLVWFSENNIYPTYWTFLDPNSLIYIIDRINNKKYNPKWLYYMKNNTNIIFHDIQGTDEFYKHGFTTSRGPNWNKNEFGGKLLPQVCSYFKETIKLPVDILESNFDPLYTPETYNLSPIIRQGPGINTDKFICFILPLVLSYFKELESIKCVGFGDFDEPRLYNNLNLGYEGYKISYSKIKDKLIELFKHRNISIEFENKNSHFIELENSTKKNHSFFLVILHLHQINVIRVL